MRMPGLDRGARYSGDTIVALFIGSILAALGVLSFFHTPSYEKGVSVITTCFIAAFTLVIGYKFGRTMPEQAGDPKAGQASRVESIITTAPLPPAKE